MAQGIIMTVKNVEDGKSCQSCLPSLCLLPPPLPLFSLFHSKHIQDGLRFNCDLAWIQMINCLDLNLQQVDAGYETWSLAHPLTLTSFYFLITKKGLIVLFFMGQTQK